MFERFFSEKKKLLWMHDFFECIYDLCLNDFFCEKMNLWNFGIFLFENTFINAWFFLECIYNVCLNDFILFYEKIHWWNFGLFLFENAFINARFCFWNAYIIYLWMIFFLMRKCIYKILDFFFSKMHLWIYDFF